mmetsp:Transcript_17906/g.55597  ORF Transcript_17906/g.55597 Transcript_17906/m.55597 type:complete len:218 (-) Transcript_17906:551-1204(-)
MRPPASPTARSSHFLVDNSPRSATLSFRDVPHCARDATGRAERRARVVHFSSGELERSLAPPEPPSSLAALLCARRGFFPLPAAGEALAAVRLRAACAAALATVTCAAAGLLPRLPLRSAFTVGAAAAAVALLPDERLPLLLPLSFAPRSDAAVTTSSTFAMTYLSVSTLRTHSGSCGAAGCASAAKTAPAARTAATSFVYAMYSRSKPPLPSSLPP